MVESIFKHFRTAGLRASIVIVAVSLAGVSWAQSPPTERPFPGDPDSRFVSDMKRDADRAYDRGDYRRAYKIVSKSLVWRGDKYAQYLMGLMNYNGQGVTENQVLGVAWLQLAAERNNQKLVRVHKEYAATLNDAQRVDVAGVYAQLQEEYGDRRVLARLVRKDRSALRDSTGSRLGQVDNLPLSIVTLSGRRIRGDEFYGSIRSRIDTRLGYLGGVVELGEFELIDEEEADDEQD